LKRKLFAILAFLSLSLFVFGLVTLVDAQTETIVWKDDMNYSSFDQMQAAGWTSEHAAGVSFGSNGVILDSTAGDTAVHYIGHFPTGIYNWKVEDQSRWISGNHIGNDVSALTENHNYAFMADGWYSEFAFYHDGAKVWTSQTGTYSEEKGTALTLAVEKYGNQINCYFNGQLKYTYTEKDSTPSQIVGVDAVSPWAGSSEYSYFKLSTITGLSSTTSATQSGSILSNPIVDVSIVGGVGAGVAATVYFVFIAGGSSPAAPAATGSGVAGGSAAAGAGGSGGGAGSGGSGGGSGSSGESTVEPSLIAQAPIGEPAENSLAGPTQPPQPTYNITSSNPTQAQMQMNSQNDTSTMQQQMIQDNQNTASQRQKIQSDLQTQIYNITQDVTANKAKTQDKMNQMMDQYIRASTDSDSAVADSGGSGGGES